MNAGGVCYCFWCWAVVVMMMMMMMTTKMLTQRLCNLLWLTFMLSRRVILYFRKECWEHMWVRITQIFYLNLYLLTLMLENMINSKFISKYLILFARFLYKSNGIFIQLWEQCNFHDLIKQWSSWLTRETPGSLYWTVPRFLASGCRPRAVVIILLYGRCSKYVYYVLYIADWA